MMIPKLQKYLFQWPSAKVGARLSILGLALGIGAPVIGAGPNVEPDEHASSIAKNLHAEAGDLLEVRLGDLHPTQAVLGIQEVYYKLGRYQAGKDAINKRFDDWCEANGQAQAKAPVSSDAQLSDQPPCECAVALGEETEDSIAPMKTAVIGRGGRLYLVDGHHTFTSFLESPDGGPDVHVRVRVLANLSQMGPDRFWRTMEANGWVYLRDENYQPITVEQLPESLGLENFRNDDFRGLLYFTRDIAYKQTPENANYQEFYWGAWLRNNPNFHLADYDLTDLTSYLAAVQRAAELMSSLNDSDEVVPGLTAGQLGRINFDASEFAKLSKSYCESKPGKVAYALYYYHNILGVLPLVTCP